MSRIVLQSDIDQQYQKTCMLIDNFGSLAVRMVARLIVLTSSFKKCSGQTTIISACRLQAKNLMNVTDSLKDCAELLRISKDTMQNLDATIRQEINNQDLMTLNQLSYGDTTSDTQVWESEMAYWDSFVGKVYVDVHNGDYDDAIELNRTNGWTARDEMQCVGYAWNRFEQLSGKAPNFSCGTADKIGASYMANPDLECVTNINDVKIPALAYHTRGYYGHVVCIEKILTDENGNHVVYYSAGNEGEKDGMLFKFIYEENPGMFNGYIQLK